MSPITVQGVDEKQLKTILETKHGLCNGAKGQYRDMARNVFAVLYGTKVTDPQRNHVTQALKAAKKCELTLDGQAIAKEDIKISTHDAIIKGKMVPTSAEWDASSLTLRLEAKSV